jgi:hypothetical protein
LTEKACISAKDALQRKRDAHVESEMAAARSLGMEAFHRGFLMYRMIKLAAHSEELKLAGLVVAKFLLSMPWKSLVPLAQKSGVLQEDADLLPVFLSYVSGLALGKAGSSNSKEYSEKRYPRPSTYGWFCAVSILMAAGAKRRIRRHWKRCR